MSFGAHLATRGANVDPFAILATIGVDVVLHAAVRDGVAADLGSDHKVLQPHAFFPASIPIHGDCESKQYALKD